jgi:acyl carrier protein
VNDQQQKILEILAEVIGKPVESIDPEQSIKSDLELDSVQVLELLSALEDEFDREISEVDAAKIETVQDILNFAPTE